MGANVVNSSEELQSKIYPNLEENYRKSEWLLDQCILTPRNDIGHGMTPASWIRCQERV